MTGSASFRFLETTCTARFSPESSGHCRVRGTNVELGIAELQRTGALIEVDGERAPHGYASVTRREVQHRAGVDSLQAGKRYLPIQLHGTAQSSIQRPSLPRHQAAGFGDCHSVDFAFHAQPLKCAVLLVVDLGRASEAAGGTGEQEIGQVDVVRRDISGRAHGNVVKGDALVNIAERASGELSDKAIRGRSAGGNVALEP